MSTPKNSKTAGMNPLLGKIDSRSKTALLTLIHQKTKELRVSNKDLRKEITQRKRVETQLEYQKGKVERQKNRLLAVFENVEECVYITDEKSVITLANKACSKMTGLPLSRIKGRKYYQVFKCQDKKGNKYPSFNPNNEVFLTKKEVLYSEHIHENAAGEKRWVGVSLTPILDPVGEVHQIVSVVRDITSLKELEHAKSEFVSVASHELRTPLTVINGYLSLLLNGDLGDLKDSVGQDNFILVLNKIYSETQRLTKLSEELLNVSRIEGGRIKLRLSEVSLDEVIKEVLAELDNLAKQKEIELKLKSMSKKSSPFQVFADKDKLKQILVNLVDNAIKYTQEKGCVEINLMPNEREVITQIQDNGPGIPTKLLPRIFDKFQQGYGSYLKENKGTGLGLYIVKSLVDLHNGKIWVKSKEGEGSVFSFSLPKQPH